MLTSLVQISLRWTDELLKDKFPVDSIDYIEVPISKIWNPKYYIFNTATEDTKLKTGEVSHENCYLYPDGNIAYQSLGLAVTKCPANILKYPMDSHLCHISFFAVDSTEKLIFSPYYRFNFFNNNTAIFENEEWSTSNLTSVFSVEHSQSTIKFYIKISRKPTYVLLNLAIPLMALAILNPCVFLLPESSGEKISYSITVLLTHVLYLNMIADRLPNSTPISLLNITMISQITISCLNVLLTILALWMYNNQEQNKPVSKLWVRFVQVLSRRVCKKSVRPNVAPDHLTDVNQKTEEDGKANLENWCEFEISITWTDVMRLSNNLSLMVNILYLIVQSVISLFLVSM
jgi:hypothetical protein